MINKKKNLQEKLVMFLDIMMKIAYILEIYHSKQLK